VARFVAVDLKLAGGSAPATAGLKWLSEKGYRTLLDLRETSEVPTTFISEVTNRGLRYIALPISKSTIDRDHVERFRYEMAATDSRPLFFFDSDGSSAGALWYIHRIVVDRVDQQIARREAEELGLSDQSYWSAAVNYIAAASGSPSKAANNAATNHPPSQPETDAAAAPTKRDEAANRGDTAVDSKSSTPPKTATPPAASPGVRRADAASQSIAQVPNGSAAAAEQNTLTPPEPSIASEPPFSSDPNAWRPLAAMVLTGLSLPVAFCCRTVVPSIVAKALASLPAPGLRPRSLPSKLDA
jgi:protein tyrosine phosphatase (PTP) superfamily phosphohydrolase (DUF442 family)